MLQEYLMYLHKGKGTELESQSFNTHDDLKYFIFSLVEVELDALGGSFGT